MYFSKRTPDYQYQDRLRMILQGVPEARTYSSLSATAKMYVPPPNVFLTGSTYQENGTFTHVNLPAMEFDLRNGVPLITERKIGFWRKPIAEIIAFINGARTAQDMAQYGCAWWDRWVTEDKCKIFGLETGDLGPGSYGAAFHDFPMPDGGTFNQFEHLVKQIRERPFLRTHVITTWIPYYTLQHSDLQRKVVVAPCHGNLQVTVAEGWLTLRMQQRSCDMPIGGPANMIQYAALTLMLAQVTGTKPYKYIHGLNDAQIYVDQVPHLEDLVARSPKPFPKLRITEPEIDDLFSFRAEHFELEEYDPHPAVSWIPVTE